YDNGWENGSLELERKLPYSKKKLYIQYGVMMEFKREDWRKGLGYQPPPVFFAYLTYYVPSTSCQRQRLSGQKQEEFEKTQEDSPEPEAHVVVRDNNQTPGEESSDSEYFSRVSSPGQLRAAAEDGKGFRAEELRLKPLHRDKLGCAFKDRTVPHVNTGRAGREPTASAGEPPAQEGSRAKTPQGLGTLDSGFRCLGCCLVFRSLEVLQAHVENAAREHFSCHVFNRAFAQMLSKHKKRARELGGENQENVSLPDQKRSRTKTSSCK
ncbi:hypothetical protein MUG91_G375n4, partial [Manis pentadactyla]